MEEFTALIAWAAQALAAWRQANPILAEGVSFACRLLAPMLTLLILVRTIRSLLTVPAQPEVWAVLGLPNGVKVPLTRWENIMGRSPSADVVVNYPSVSRSTRLLSAGETMRTGRYMTLALRWVPPSTDSRWKAAPRSLWGTQWSWAACPWCSSP